METCSALTWASRRAGRSLCWKLDLNASYWLYGPQWLICELKWAVKILNTPVPITLSIDKAINFLLNFNCIESQSSSGNSLLILNECIFNAS